MQKKSDDGSATSKRSSMARHQSYDSARCRRFHQPQEPNMKLEETTSLRSAAILKSSARIILWLNVIALLLTGCALCPPYIASEASPTGVSEGSWWTRWGILYPVRMLARSTQEIGRQFFHLCPINLFLPRKRLIKMGTSSLRPPKR